MSGKELKMNMENILSIAFKKNYKEQYYKIIFILQLKIFNIKTNYINHTNLNIILNNI